MSSVIILFLLLIIGVMVAMLFYQHIRYHKGINQQLTSICEQLAAILDADSEEKIMVFTDQKTVQKLMEQMNRLLLAHLRMKADYRRTEASSRNMLSNISHDIKTPMTVILGYLEMMRIQAPEDTCLLKIENKANQVMELIQQFFTLAKLESGDTPIDMQRVNVAEICQEVILGYYDILTQRNFEVEIRIPDSDLYVWGSEESIRRILNNLLSNAVRYGSDGHYLGLTITSTSTQASVMVTDKGKGIEAPYLPLIFDRLYTMEDSRNKSIEGNGLGLTIARNLAQQLGGDLVAASNPHVQTTFTLSLRCAPAPAVYSTENR